MVYVVIGEKYAFIDFSVAFFVEFWE